MSLTCLDTLVGLSSRECNCLSGSRPSGYDTSDSGYYLDDREYGFPVADALLATQDCGEGSVWDMLSTARDQAIRDFKVDLQQALTSVRDSNIINWRGTIAKAESTGYNNTTTGTAGLQLRPRYRLKDASFVVKAVWVGLDTTKSLTLNFTSNDVSFSGTTRAVTATAGQWVRNALEVPVTLPMFSIARTDVKYNVHYSLDGAKAYNNRVSCCSPPPWMKHMDAYGILDASFADDTIYASGYAYGLAIEGYFTCAKLDWICDIEEMNGLDFRDLLGRCIQFKAAVKLMSMVLESGKVNYFTILDAEGLERRRGKLQKMYSEYLLWVAQNLPANVTSCWGCEKHAPRVQAILV